VEEHGPFGIKVLQIKVKSKFEKSEDNFSDNLSAQKGIANKPQGKWRGTGVWQLSLCHRSAKGNKPLYQSGVVKVGSYFFGIRIAEKIPTLPLTNRHG
jgi:hypothetical protein